MKVRFAHEFDAWKAMEESIIGEDGQDSEEMLNKDVERGEDVEERPPS